MAGSGGREERRLTVDHVFHSCVHESDGKSNCQCEKESLAPLLSVSGRREGGVEVEWCTIMEVLGEKTMRRGSFLTSTA